MAYDFSNVSILIVDDEDLIREILTETFMMYGATVDSAENGNVAYNKIVKNEYDIVISDVRMPNGDGIELFNKIHDLKKKNMKLLVCSAYNDLTDAQVKDLNIVRTFNKPFDLNSILDGVKDILATQ